MSRTAGFCSRVLPRNDVRNVLIAIQMNSSIGQEKLSGFYRYVGEHGGWTVQVMRSEREFSVDVARAAVAGGIDGFVLGLPEATELTDYFAELNVPTVLLEMSSVMESGCRIQNRTSNVAFVSNDPEAIGRAAARDLMSCCRARAFAFLGHFRAYAWSRSRGRAFVGELAKAGIRAKVLERDHPGEHFRRMDELTDWVRRLPSSVAVFAASDSDAERLIVACGDCGRKVPEDVAVLGVNNESVLCESCAPRLSSVHPDFELEGYRAAAALDELMRGKAVRRSPIVVRIGVREIVHRDSTPSGMADGRVVERALDFISKHAASRPSPDAIADALGVSRRLLDLRFKEAKGPTVAEAVLAANLEEVRRRLECTTDLLDVISLECGWKHPNSLKNAFRRVYGETMRSVRQRLPEK